MKMRNLWQIAAMTAAAAAPASALAHGGPMSGMESGLFHPFTGADHLLALIAMGMWAAASRHRAGGKLALSLAALAAGATLALAGISLPFLETGLVASVLTLGLMIAMGASLPRTGPPLVAAFALLHGHAHGAAIPSDGASLAFVVGLVAGSAAIQVTALRFTTALEKNPLLVRAGGVLMVAAGVALAAARWQGTITRSSSGTSIQDRNRKIDAAGMIGRIKKLMRVKRRGVVLFHDTKPEALAALPDVIRFTKLAGLTWIGCRQHGAAPAGEAPSRFPVQPR